MRNVCVALIAVGSLLCSPAQIPADEPVPELSTETLWEEIDTAQTEGNWKQADHLLRLLQQRDPSSLKAWQIQAWMLAFSVSEEMDRFEDRYSWIKRGIRVLLKARKPTQNHPIILWEAGLILHRKFGLADGRTVYRQLFKNDQQFHRELAQHVDLKQALGVDGKPDQFLVARLLFVQAVEELEKRGGNLGAKENEFVPLVYLPSYPVRALVDYAHALNREQAEEKDVLAIWKQAEQAWKEYGNRPIYAHDPESKELKKIILLDQNPASARLRATVNYHQWEKRITWEQKPQVREARRLLLALEEVLDQPEPNHAQARKLFDAMVIAWTRLLKDDSYRLLEDDNVCTDVGLVLEDYGKFTNKPFPDDFPLWPIIRVSLEEPK